MYELYSFCLLHLIQCHMYIKVEICITLQVPAQPSLIVQHHEGSCVVVKTENNPQDCFFSSPSTMFQILSCPFLILSRFVSLHPDALQKLNKIPSYQTIQTANIHTTLYMFIWNSLSPGDDLFCLYLFANKSILT